MKLIGFTGAGGTGKSTIASNFNNIIKSPVDDIRKIVYGQDSKYGDIKDIEEFVSFQRLILETQMHMWLAKYNKFKDTDEVIISERSPIDYAAYMAHMEDKGYNEVINYYIDDCISYTDRNYNAIVYFPMSSFIAKNDVNSSKERNIESAKKTDDYIQGFLDCVEVPVLTLKSTKIEDRIEEIKNFIYSI